MSAVPNNNNDNGGNKKIMNILRKVQGGFGLKFTVSQEMQKSMSVAPREGVFLFR